MDPQSKYNAAISSQLFGSQMLTSTQSALASAQERGLQEMAITGARRITAEKGETNARVLKIDNGFTVLVNGATLYGETPQDIADLIVAQWTKKQLEAS